MIVSNDLALESMAEVDSADLSLPVIFEADSRRLDVISWVKENRSQVDTMLKLYGGVLLRKFRVNGVAHFERFIEEAFDHSLLNYENRSTPRSVVKGHVYTSTEYPNNQSIPLHNENAYTRSWARKIFFYCIKASDVGGETPIADSRKIFNRIPDELKARFDRHGLLYVRNYSGLDLPWQDVFNTTDKQQVEVYCQQNDIECEWVADDHLRTKQYCQSIAQHPETGEWVWFNQAHLFHISNLDKELRQSLLDSFAHEDLPRNVYLGDGSEIAEADLELIRGIYQDLTVSFAWQSGDILLLDNMLSAHGRHPYEGQRKVVVGMIEPYKNQVYKQLLPTESI
ncbi:MAG: TauD/TfdA family dioxygenase [Arenicella sp.]|nr:TauD/TfdA family dioxygenase [Arenicella sp.]